MIGPEQYRYLDGILRTNPTVRPTIAVYAFQDGHVPVHTQCQLTAMHLERTRGWGAQIGIQWLNKDGRLLPWPHVINWIGEELIDYSCPINEPKLGFTLTGNDVAMANALTRDIDGSAGQAGGWADPLLQRLHDDWFVRLRNFGLGLSPSL